jgi:hypothetical protein
MQPPNLPHLNFPHIFYPELCELARPGDVIVFTGKDIPSSVVKLATQSDYVHVAIVLAVIDEHPEGQILIAESHIDSSLPCSLVRRPTAVERRRNRQAPNLALGNRTEQNRL